MQLMTKLDKKGNKMYWQYCRRAQMWIRISAVVAEFAIATGAVHSVTDGDFLKYGVTIVNEYMVGNTKYYKTAVTT